MPAWGATIGMIGCLLLGSGVFGLWIADPKITWASYLLAGGGLGLGISLWFGQPPEVSVAVGDSGIAVETGRQTERVHWFELKSIRAKNGLLFVEGREQTLRFSIGANSSAVAMIFKEAAERTPDVMDIDAALLKSLPDVEKVRGLRADIEDDQVAGMHCAASDTLIQLQEEARLCPRCGQVYHRAHIPERCIFCEESLRNKTLLA